MTNYRMLVQEEILRFSGFSICKVKGHDVYFLYDDNDNELGMFSTKRGAIVKALKSLREEEK